MKIKVINSLYFSVDYMRLSGNVNIEKLGSLTPPNFHLVFEMEFQMTVPWKFYMRLPCFQSVQIQTRLSTWKMSFKINMKSSWLWNSKYIFKSQGSKYFLRPIEILKRFLSKYRTIWIQLKVCCASNRYSFRPQKCSEWHWSFQRWMEGTNGDLNAFSITFALASKKPNTLLVPHETFMSNNSKSFEVFILKKDGYF